MIIKILFWENPKDKPTITLIDCIEASYKEPTYESKDSMFVMQVRRKFGEEIFEFYVQAGSTVFFMEDGKTIDSIQFHDNPKSKWKFSEVTTGTRSHVSMNALIEKEDDKRAGAPGTRA